MNDPENQTTETPTAESPTAAQAEAPATASATAEPTPVVVVDATAVLTSERDKLKEQLLRTLADFDNYRKRTAREKQDELRRGKEDILRELLPVFDNLERASSSARPDADVAAIAKGIQMVIRLFEDTLTRVGAKRVVAVGATFDPNIHEAIAQVESNEHAAGTIAQELVPGYTFGERLLRAAMVAVSKGSAAPVEVVATPDDVTTN
jgi:molecular chaperone GrpE